MLGMDDKDLNSHVSLKKLAPYKEDDGEKMVLKKMKKKKWLEKKPREDTEHKTETSGWSCQTTLSYSAKESYIRKLCVEIGQEKKYPKESVVSERILMLQ